MTTAQEQRLQQLQEELNFYVDQEDEAAAEEVHYQIETLCAEIEG